METPARRLQRTPTQPIHEFWARAHQLAAGPRLALARHYRDQPARLDDEYSGLQAIQAWLNRSAEGGAAQLLLEYADLLAPYLRGRARHRDQLAWCEDAVRACGELGWNAGPWLWARGQAQISLGQWDAASASLQRAMRTTEGVEPAIHAKAVLAFGTLQFNRGQYCAALKTLRRAEALFASRSDYEGLAEARSEMAAYHLNRGDPRGALKLYLEADQLRRTAGAVESSDHTLLMLGIVYRNLKDYPRAASHLQALVKREEEHGNPAAVATGVHHLAWAHLRQNDTERARQLCGRALDLYLDMADTRGLSDAYEQLGCIDLMDGKPDAAVNHLHQSLTLRRSLGNQHGQASSLRRLAVAHSARREWRAAFQFLRQSLLLYWQLNMLGRQRLLQVVYEFFTGRPI